MFGFHILDVRFLCSNAITQHRTTYRTDLHTSVCRRWIFCLFVWCFGCLVGWLKGWKVERLVGWLVGWLVVWLIGLSLSSTQNWEPLFLPKPLYPEISLTLSYIRRPYISTIPAHKPTIHNKYITKISDKSIEAEFRSGTIVSSIGKSLKVSKVEVLLPTAFLHAFENLHLKSVCGKYV